LHPEQFAITQNGELSIRVPDIFPKTALTEPAEIARPPFMLDYPGFKFSYEGTPSGQGAENSPYYMYLGAVDAQAATYGVTADQAIEGIRRLNPNAQWEKVAVQTPSGGTLNFDKASATGDMLFRGTMAPGVMEVYMFTGGGYKLLVGFRWPDKVGTQLNLPNLVELSLGTLQVQDPSGQPAA
jgi:hypothetical protein